MSLLQERACPDCGAVSTARAMYSVDPVPCPSCRLKRGLARAQEEARSGGHYCPACEVAIAAAGWGKHTSSQAHRASVRVMASVLLDARKAVTA